ERLVVAADGSDQLRHRLLQRPRVLGQVAKRLVRQRAVLVEADARLAGREDALLEHAPRRLRRIRAQVRADVAEPEVGATGEVLARARVPGELVVDAAAGEADGREPDVPPLLVREERGGEADGR